jgi:hypothetical protein
MWPRPGGAALRLVVLARVALDVKAIPAPVCIFQYSPAKYTGLRENDFNVYA